MEERKENNQPLDSSPKVDNKLSISTTGLKDKVLNFFRSAERTGEIYSEVIDKTNKLAETRRDIEAIKAKTKIELANIDKSHDRYMSMIDNEYGKQSRAMDIAEDVVTKGLEDDDLNKIALGLQNVTGIANHNPFENFQQGLDNDLKKLNEGMEDDDFIIEI